MTTLMLGLGAGTAGFIAAIFVWPRLRRAMVGIENEIDDLRSKARALEAKLRG